MAGPIIEIPRRTRYGFDVGKSWLIADLRKGASKDNRVSVMAHRSNHVSSRLELPYKLTPSPVSIG